MRSPIGVTDPIFKKILKKNRKKIETQKKNCLCACFYKTNENEIIFIEKAKKLIDNQRKLNENEKNFNNFQKFLVRSFQPEEIKKIEK